MVDEGDRCAKSTRWVDTCTDPHETQIERSSRATFEFLVERLTQGCSAGPRRIRAHESLLVTRPTGHWATQLATLVFSNLQHAQTLWKAGSQLLSQLCRPSRSFSFAQPLPFHSANCLQLMESAEPELMNEPLETFEVECAEGEHDLQTPWSWWFDKKVSVLLTSVTLCEFHQSVTHQPHNKSTATTLVQHAHSLARSSAHWLTKGIMPPRFCRVALPFFVCAVSMSVAQ